MLRKIASHARRISYHLGRSATFWDQNFKLHGYYASRLGIFNKMHEAYMVPVFRRQLDSNPGTFVDIGVNVGQTLLKVLGSDRNRNYAGFEPQVACCYNVQQFLHLNGLQNAEILPIALSDYNSIMTFYSRDQFDVMASLMTNKSQKEVKGVMPVASHV